MLKKNVFVYCVLALYGEDVNAKMYFKGLGVLEDLHKMNEYFQESFEYRKISTHFRLML